MLFSDDDMDSENRTAQSGDEADEVHEQEDEKWRVERLEREKWMQGKTLAIKILLDRNNSSVKH